MPYGGRRTSAQIGFPVCPPGSRWLVPDGSSAKSPSHVLEQGVLSSGTTGDGNECRPVLVVVVGLDFGSFPAV